MYVKVSVFKVIGWRVPVDSPDISGRGYRTKSDIMQHAVSYDALISV
jgi:hypothetical protein